MEYSKHSAMMSRMFGIYSAYSGIGTDLIEQTFRIIPSNPIPELGQSNAPLISTIIP